jgi:hypothetical protein
LTDANTKAHSEQYDKILLEYAEDLLEPEQRRMVAEHVAQCPKCSQEVRDLQKIIGALRKNRQAFCPESWEIYEYVKGGGTLSEALSIHFKQCARCRDELESYTVSTDQETMPPQLWSQVKDRLERIPGTEKIDKQEKRSFDIWSWILGRFRWPAVGVAAAAAAILVMVSIFPREAMEPMVGLSTVTWEKVPKPKTGVESSREKLAVLIFFKHFKEPMSKKKVDLLYESLAPSIEVNERYDVVPPVVLTGSIKNGEINPFDRKALLQDLRTKFNAKTVALVIIEPAERGFDVKCDLVQVPDGTVLKDKIARGVAQADLDSTVREAVWDTVLGYGAK